MKAAGLLKACISAWEERRGGQCSDNGKQRTPVGPGVRVRAESRARQPADSASLLAWRGHTLRGSSSKSGGQVCCQQPRMAQVKGEPLDSQPGWDPGPGQTEF